MDKKSLQKEIERVWGPYSEQSQTYKSLLSELCESQNTLRKDRKDTEFIEKNETAPVRGKISWKDIAYATTTFYFTRAVLILGTWAIFIAVTATMLFVLSLAI